MKYFLLPIFSFFVVFIGQSQQTNYPQYYQYVKEHYDFDKHYDAKKNLYVDGNTVHIFIDDEGNLLETGMPTTAIEEYSYKLHLITNSNIASKTKFEYSTRGVYNPQLNIKNESVQNGTTEHEFVKNEPKAKVVEYIYATAGPYTSDFTITLKKESGGTTTTILDAKIDVAKTYHVTISTGLFGTSLQNPTNIRLSTNTNGEPTLVADDVGIRGMVALTAVFYPKGRSFLFPPSGGLFSPDRFGILVGTQLNKDQFENFIGGMQFDFARGGSVAFGIHCGRRNKVAGYRDFKFGDQKFEGDFESAVVKEWNVGVFVGVNLDIRIFGQLFKVTT